MTSARITDNQYEKLSRNTLEILKEEHIPGLLDKPKKQAYIGYEPSGEVHLGWLVTLQKIQDLLYLGFEVTILLADTHAKINDKFGGESNKIKNCAEYLKHCVYAYGISSSSKIKFKYSSDMINTTYWNNLMYLAEKTTFNKINKSITIMGRQQTEILSFSKYLYPLMQINDILLLNVDLVLAGIDQRRAHVLAIDLFKKTAFKDRNIVYVHVPLIRSLTSSSRMGAFEDSNNKMSKSNRAGGIFISDSPEQVINKIEKVYLDPSQIDSSPLYDILNLLLADDEYVFNKGGPEKVCGLLTGGKISPKEFKSIISNGINLILDRFRNYFTKLGLPLNFIK